MNKEKILKALKMIELACFSIDCINCPFYENKSCNFRNVMSVPPYDWDLNFLTEKEN